MSPDQQQTPGEAAQTEAARQLVVLIMSAAGLLVYVWIERSQSDPDAFRSHRMRLAKMSERFWARVAARAWGLAEQARLEYERGRA